MSTVKGFRDDNAPSALTAVIVDTDGNEWGRIPLLGKTFSTGSVGFYGSDKIHNPHNPHARYQAGLTFTLIGSKG